MTTRRTPNLTVGHEYRDSEQKIQDQLNRRKVLTSAARHAIAVGEDDHHRIRVVFFELVDELDLWECLVETLRKRHPSPRREQLLELVELARESRLTSVTEQ